MNRKLFIILRGGREVDVHVSHDVICFFSYVTHIHLRKFFPKIVADHISGKAIRHEMLIVWVSTSLDCSSFFTFIMSYFVSCGKFAEHLFPDFDFVENVMIHTLF